MVLKDDSSARWGKPLPGGPSRSYKAMGWVGFGLLIVGLLDFGLAWVPPRFSDSAWRLTSAAQGLDALPIPTLGMVLLLVAGFHARRRWWALASGAAGLTLIFAILVSVGLWAPSVPLALETAPAELEGELFGMVLEMAIQSLVYPAVFAYLARMGLLYGPSIPAK